MAKKAESIYKNWDEVNLALKELSELQIKKEKLEGDTNIKINQIKEKSAKIGLLLDSAIKLTKKNIERFAESNKSEFTKTRSKKLTFGTISYKISKSVTFNNKEEECIKSLKSLNLDFVLNIKESVDKNKCLEVDEKLLLKAGISISTKDKVRIEPNVIKFVANQAE
ncbi:MAG: host-nuclease inhibitor Gam family protein [Candidatus Gastranaerophilaceae bacterium]